MTKENMHCSSKPRRNAIASGPPNVRTRRGGEEDYKSLQISLSDLSPPFRRLKSLFEIRETAAFPWVS